MSKKDKIKEKIGFLKFWLGVCVAILLSVGNWLIFNFKKLNLFYFLVCVFFVAISIIVYKLVLKITKYINELEEL